MSSARRWVGGGILVALLSVGTVATATGATRGAAAAWAQRLLAGRAALVEEAPCRGTTPMLERYGPMLEGSVGRGASGDSSVVMMRTAMTMGIERLKADWEEGGELPRAGNVPAYAVERLGLRVDPARVRSFAARVLGLRRVLVRVHGAEMGVRARLVILSLLRQVFVADATAGLFPDPLAGSGRRSMLDLLDALLVGFSTDDEQGRGLPADLCEAGLARLAWFDGIFPLQARRVAQTPAALTSLARALSARAAGPDRLEEGELLRFEELVKEALPPHEVLGLAPRERLRALEAWRPHLNARTRDGLLWEAAEEGREGDRPRALLRALLSSAELTDDCARELRLQGLVRGLAVAWGAAVYRQRHEGRAPSSWAELRPLVPPALRSDPISGGLLRFAPDHAKAMRVWSDGFRDTPAGWGDETGCVDLVPRYGDRWHILIP